MTITCPTWQSAFSMSVPDVAFCCFTRFNSLVLSVRWFHAMTVPGQTATRMRLKSHKREWCLVEVALLGVAPSPEESSTKAAWVATPAKYGKKSKHPELLVHGDHGGCAWLHRTICPWHQSGPVTKVEVK